MSTDSASNDLWDRARRGDRDALASLLKRNGPATRRGLAGRIPKRWQSVLSEDDVMQQTYADASASIAQFNSRSEGSFAKWLTTAAWRNLRDAIKMLEADKRGGNRKRVELGKSGESFVALYELIACTGTTPSRQAARTEAETALKKAIEKLPADYARVVRIYDLEGRPVQEVAEALNRSAGAVFMLRSRAHQRLHEIMGCTSKYFGISS